MPNETGPRPLRGPFHSENELRTYAILWRASRALVPESGELESATCLVVGVLCSFTLEAYLNHVGARQFKMWDRLERRLGPEEKLELLEETTSTTFDRAKQPFQAFTEIFSFRNKVAHGKDEIWVELSANPLALFERLSKRSRPLAEWEQACRPAVVRRWLAAVEAIIRSIHKVVGPVDPPPWDDPLGVTFTSALRVGDPRPGLKRRKAKQR